MASRKVDIAFFGLGLGVFTYLVLRFGIGRIAENIERAGWSLLYIIAVWFAIYLLNASAWKLVLGADGQGIRFRKLFMITVSGFVINYITPVIALGGEPYKIKALERFLGAQHSVSAVVLYRMVHLIGHMLLLLTGILAAILFLSLPLAVVLTLAVLGVLIILVVGLTLSGHRDGVFQRIAGLLGRFPFARRISTALTVTQNDLAAMDEVITRVYRHERWKFYSAVLLEVLSRVAMGVEVFLILRGIGVETSLLSALFLYVSYSIIINLLFFIPLNLGAREGGLALGLGSLALPPLLGVYLGVVMRIREFFWILLGLLFIVLGKEKVDSPSTRVAS